MRIRYNLLRLISVLLVISHCVSIPLQAGILPEMLVYASTEVKPISSVNTQEHLIAHDVDGNIISRNVSYMQRMVRNCIVQITCDDQEIIYADTQQQFFVPDQGAWKCASDITVGTRLYTIDGTYVTVQDVVIVHGFLCYLCSGC